MSDFSSRLVAWQARSGRKDLPWQGGVDPYRIWVSEIMLQQTQVATVIPYFLRFMAAFPDIAALAEAPTDEVLGLWSGLGYYARARNLHRAARRVAEAHGGRFPGSASEIAQLPGIGRSTAAAIAAFAYGERVAILDGNVKRVLTRCFAVAGFPGEKAVEARLWTLAEKLLPDEGVARYTQGLMDLGATVCTRSRPACPVCPMAADCLALAQGRVHEFPAPRPRRERPSRQETVLIMLEGDGVLLEKRPPTGIWGGLLALPVLPEACEDPLAWIARVLGLEVDTLEPLPGLRHDFTHFRLEMLPLVGRVRAPLPAAHQDALSWLSLAPESLAPAPLPAPVRKLLEECRVALG
ncbi:MAG: A/G-specific adenine glycosylase [Rhodocyclaceae bacterium]|nr:A/G-specific adenine glycosylase [Rhodocyclaceae bacterium]